MSAEVMTEEEMRREKRNKYEREYIRRRKQTDPKYAEDLRKYERERRRHKKQTDPKYREHQREYHRQYDLQRRRRPSPERQLVRLVRAWNRASEPVRKQFTLQVGLIHAEQ
jgi:hypothetical protein